MSIEYGADKIPYIDLGQGYKIRLEYEEITDEKYIEKAKVELRETPENVAEGIKIFKELVLEEEKDLTFPANADQLFYTFLRPCKFYPQSAFEKAQKFFKFKLKHKKTCDDLDVESVRTVFEDDLVKYLPLRDKEGRRIVYLNCGKRWDYTRVSPLDIFRSLQLSLIAAMAEPMTQVNGVVVIMDMSGLSVSHVLQLTPSFAAMVLDWVQNCIAVRLKGIYVINNSYIFNMAFAIFKPFIGSKLRKRIHFMNKDWNKLNEAIGSHAVRKEFGGDLDYVEPDGKTLVEFLKLFDKQFELMSVAGYNLDEQTKKRIEEGVQEALGFIIAK